MLLRGYDEFVEFNWNLSSTSSWLFTSSTQAVEVFHMGTEQGQVGCWCSLWKMTFLTHLEIVGSWACIPGSAWRTNWSQMWSTLPKSQKCSIHPTWDVQVTVPDLCCISAHTWCGKETTCRRRVKCTKGRPGGVEYRGGEGHSAAGVGFGAGWCGIRSLSYRLHGVKGKEGRTWVTGTWVEWNGIYFGDI